MQPADERAGPDGRRNGTLAIGVSVGGVEALLRPGDGLPYAEQAILPSERLADNVSTGSDG
ncbi:hypothetical protein BST27_16710 [Mycobacterium intermedium]|uniref:Uncharacterized protein n=1 Tax=Mycobacterium intermedium TaxID=28445 RepID=A0A1E3SJY4_MYCIE|nr:hypothetical protein [Mycobacterium intermedium]MCV6965613.1 hypothetical protein [Mycobacterium intermedium]ODR02429.1 hypothetical protein BHQ20_04970 [Mycobacterium intermedium]OPE51634.1 hypothetical protein BV508_05870 [Mycobacterium intermedium]ORB02259.1 hypothetical protein BST27_16710 [Mycobacterium intermedium]